MILAAPRRAAARAGNREHIRVIAPLVGCGCPL
jgi:hypothetical protein